MAESQSRWAGRNPMKTAVRNRVWERLVATGVNVGPAFDRDPELRRRRRGRQAPRANSTPGSGRGSSNAIPTRRRSRVRLRALYDGKLLFSPVPYLTKGFPYLRIDPEKLAAKGVDFETAATAQGFLEHGEPVGFEDMPQLDFCVVGCVAVTRARRTHRQGRGLRRSRAGHLSRSLASSATRPRSPRPSIPRRWSTTARWSWRATIRALALHRHRTRADRDTQTPYPPAGGRRWDKVRPDQFADIPFLSELRVRSRTGSARHDRRRS